MGHHYVGWLVDALEKSNRLSQTDRKFHKTREHNQGPTDLT